MSEEIETVEEVTEVVEKPAKPVKKVAKKKAAKKVAEAPKIEIPCDDCKSRPICGQLKRCKRAK